VVFPGVLVTQSFLQKEQIKDMAGLRAKLSAPWIRAVTF
jgi:hypothetical protein